MSHHVTLGRKMNITDIQKPKDAIRREFNPASGAAVRTRADMEEGRRDLADLEAEIPRLLARLCLRELSKSEAGSRIRGGQGGSAGIFGGRHIHIGAFRGSHQDSEHERN